MSNTIGPRLSLAAFGALLLVAASGVPAQSSDEFDRTQEQCITVTAIDRTYIVDDQTVLFFLRGKKAYRNFLTHKCFGLKNEDRFAYRTSGRLCAGDSITVLEQNVFGTFGFREGQTCPLGTYQPLTTEEAADLTRKPKDRDTRKKVEATVVELPPEKAAAPAEQSSEPAADDDKADEKN